ncbi:MAG TPA: 4'-phosphopantetheinyl transferase superfamily protein [Solirubrobacterales bacterium]|nr:4'-phosphopantetheinyl transferase superfamily protein [Solirubrobacterales bacterium]
MNAWRQPPSRPRVIAGEVHLWLADLEAPGWPPASMLPPDERERARRMRAPRARDRWVAARWALRRVLGLYLDRDPADVRLSLAEHGKPELAGERSLRFNLSHTGPRALVAVALDREVGVDIEAVDPERDVAGLARFAFSPEEAAALQAVPAPRRPAAFHRAWVRKEAIAKCHGVGLAAELPAGAVWVTPVDAGADVAAALAASGEPVSHLELFLLNP